MAGDNYYRRDQEKGITAPKLDAGVSFVEHVVRARGKKTQYTSISHDVNRISHFDGVDYEVLHTDVVGDGHLLVPCDALQCELKKVAYEGEKAEAQKATRALGYVRKNLESLIDWKFNVATVAPKDIIAWAYSSIQKYFRKM